MYTRSQQYKYGLYSSFFLYKYGMPASISSVLVQYIPVWCLGTIYAACAQCSVLPIPVSVHYMYCTGTYRYGTSLVQVLSGMTVSK